jgi:polar amino acid transport system substrate-binding protein
MTLKKLRSIFKLLTAVFGLATAPIWATQAKPSLLMVADSWCPYNCEPSALKRGYMIDVLEKVLGQHYQLSYQLIPWTRAVSMVQDDKAQLLVASTFSESPQLKPSVLLGAGRICFFARKDNPWRYNSINDLKGLRLGVVQDYTYDDGGPLDAFLASSREQNATGFEIATGANAIETSFRKLNAGRMDVVLENENVGLHTIRSLKL